MVPIAALIRFLRTLELPAKRVADGVFTLDRPMDEFITVATYDKVIDAHIALGRLAAEGIEAQLFDENMVQMDWLYAIALGGIKLRVTRSDEKAARDVLATDYSASLNDVDVGKPEN